MISPYIFIPTLFAFLMGLAVTNAGQRLYLSAGDQVSVYSTGDHPEIIQQLDVPGAGSFTFSPDGKQMYIMSSSKKGAAIQFAEMLKDGQITLTKTVPIAMRGGDVNADATGNFLASNHYAKGKVSIWDLRKRRGNTLAEITLEERAHAVRFSPDNRFLLVPATAPNKIFILRFDEKTGDAVPHKPPFSLGPQGADQARQPRHLIFHPSANLIYSTHERELPGVGVWEWDAASGRLEVVQNIVTQPQGFDGRISTSTLHLTPDARWLYVSNRDVTDKKAVSGEDSIVCFKVDAQTGRLELVRHTPCERIPRSFCIGPEGKYVYVAGQGDAKLGVYQIQSNTGELQRTARIDVGLRPAWVRCRKVD